jgi:hypothetical protein
MKLAKDTFIHDGRGYSFCRTCNSTSKRYGQAFDLDSRLWVRAVKCENCSTIKQTRGSGTGASRKLDSFLAGTMELIKESRNI